MPLGGGPMSFGLQEKMFSSIIDEPTATALVSPLDNAVYPILSSTDRVHYIHLLFVRYGVLVYGSGWPQTKLFPPLSPKNWNYRHVIPPPAHSLFSINYWSTLKWKTGIPLLFNLVGSHTK